MNIEERKPAEEEKLNQNQTVDLFKAIVMGKEITETIETSRGEFKIKYPRLFDLEEIGRKTAWRLNGIPVRCFDANTYNLIQYIATLDVIVLDGPDWYKLAKKENNNFSWADMPDQDFISEVYAKAYMFREKVSEQIKGNKDKGNTGMAAVSDNGNSGEPGLFDGMSGQS